MEPETQEVAPDVFAYVQPDGSWCLNNAGIVRGGDELMLIDTVATTRRALRLRAAAAELSVQPPNIIVNTHFHGDHCFGNHVFPEATIVGHERTRSEARTAGLHLTTLWPEVDWGEIALRPPSVTYNQQMRVYVGELEVELRYAGPAHSADDTVVWLPHQKVLFTGDIAMAGVTPFVQMGSVAGSLAALDSLRALQPDVVVPGHGPVGGPEILDATTDYLCWLEEQADIGISAGLTVLELAAQISLGEYAELRDSERLVPNLHRAYAEADGADPGDPLDLGLMFAEMVRYHGRLPTCRA
ncbi:MBL fold metallo-hydrolase [Nocardia sp. NPDC055002]